MQVETKTNTAGKQELLTSRRKGNPLIARTWFGRTRREFAEEYLQYNYENGLLEIEKKPGNLGVQSFCKINGDIAEITTISYWASMQAMEAMHAHGGDVRRVAHLEKDPDYLLELPEFVEVSELHVNDWQPSAGS